MVNRLAVTGTFYGKGWYKTWQRWYIQLAVVTNESVSPIHDRMPLIIQKDHIEEWITDLNIARNYLKADMPELSRTEVE